MTPTSTHSGSSSDLSPARGPTATLCELKAGSHIQRYHVLQEIGRGGHGVVYRATDTALGREVALKTVVPTRPECRTRDAVLPEAQLLSRVDDRHVVGIFDVIRHGEATVLVMEFVRGPSLDVLVRAEKLSAREVSALGIQLAEGLAALHRAGIVHGDIKPANLRLSSTGVLKILDFSAARLVEDRIACSQSFTEVVGTIPYMAPEQLRGAIGDMRSDIWSAGTVLFELATGERAFGKLSTTSRLYRIVNGIVPRPQDIRSEVTPALEQVILQALNPDPESRFQSALDLIAALYDVLAEDIGASSRRTASNTRPLSAIPSITSATGVLSCRA